MMLRAAIEKEPRFVTDDCELRRPPPSYTINTVQEIQRRQPDAEVCLIIGDDNVIGLPKWHLFAKLEKMVRIVVLNRTGAVLSHSYTTIPRKIDISATEIRKRVASGQSIRYLVPPAVEEIIRRENLYREQVK